MAITLSNLVEQSKTLKIDVFGGELEVKYNPGKITPNLISRLNTAGDEDAAFEDVAKVFCTVISYWNIEGPLGEEGEEDYVEPGANVPVEPKYMSHIPTSVLRLIFEALGNDASPKS